MSENSTTTSTYQMPRVSISIAVLEIVESHINTLAKEIHLVKTDMNLRTGQVHTFSQGYTKALEGEKFFLEGILAAMKEGTLVVDNE